MNDEQLRARGALIGAGLLGLDVNPVNVDRALELLAERHPDAALDVATVITRDRLELEDARQDALARQVAELEDEVKRLRRAAFLDARRDGRPRPTWLDGGLEDDTRDDELDTLHVELETTRSELALTRAALEGMPGRRPPR